ALFLFSSSAASAANPVGKDGTIHACYKAKGKGKGALRLVGSGKVRCPRQWRKVTWQTVPAAGPRGEAGAPGAAGVNGLPGVDAGDRVVGLEAEIAQLLVKVEALEGVLKGVTNQGLLGAIELSPVVQVLCNQAGTLTGRLNLLEGVLGGLSLNGVLTTLGGLLNIPALPGALPAFSCPTAP
nr:hypothetical protein [Actinomycetota bacterium]